MGARWLLILFFYLLLFVVAGAGRPVSAAALAGAVIDVGVVENGSQRTGLSAIWHDPSGNAGLSQAVQAWQDGVFEPLHSAGSTGLQKGSHWSYFILRNPTTTPLTLHLEYIDHQLIGLAAFQRDLDGSGAEQKHSDTAIAFAEIASLEMGTPFSTRPVPHNRFVVPVALQPGTSYEFLVRFDSREAGFAFPS
ncbi:7TM-DISM domain-containing protein [Microbulbifer bruguierae]|uniref:7TM-DISM domain-containing protein n=1 Tax=Microbulbifer bruguierae TaxID=3029061 RepID=A0ABY8NHH0_9GAMM|nr:7TM-DISM domain-containing protein [Microbulbifer bruguierae]WGL18145.1 7TM-DISM domain-containing protein [Microbulbifer bruguierae]